MLQPCPGAGAAPGLPGCGGCEKEICRHALAFPGAVFPFVPFLSSSSCSLLHPIPFPVELLNGATLQQLIRPEVPSRAQICQ